MKSRQPQNTLLYVQVFHQGEFKFEKRVKINSLLRRTIKMGSKKNAEIFIPFLKTDIDVDMFRVGKGQAEVFLNERAEGFLNNVQQHSDIQDFLHAHESINNLYSAPSAPAVALPIGARGHMQLHGLEIIFKVAKATPPQTPQKITRKKISAETLVTKPKRRVSLEKKLLPIGVFSVGIAATAIALGLARAPASSGGGLLRVPMSTVTGFVAPETVRLLPYIYQQSFQIQNAIKLSLLWLVELNQRWNCAENGETCPAPVIPLLAEAKNNLSPLPTIQNFSEKIEKNLSALKQKPLPQSTEPAPFVLNATLQLAAPVAGERGESNFVVLSRRIEQLQQTEKALFKQAQQELKNPLGEEQKLAYAQAENLAQQAQKYHYRERLRAQIKKNAKKESGPVFISSLGLISAQKSDFSLIHPEQSPEMFTNLFHNAMYSSGTSVSPIQAKPKPTVPFESVESVLNNHKLEIKTCYNEALRQNINLQGEMVLTWKISELGKASDFHISKPNLADKVLEACLASQLMAWDFPKAQNGEAEVNFEIIFKKEQK